MNNLATNHTREHTGFSLLELLIVVAIIGLLSAIAIPAYQTYTKDSHRNRAMAVLEQISIGMERYYTGHNKYEGSINDLGRPKDSVYDLDAERSADYYDFKVTLEDSNQSYYIVATPKTDTTQKGNGKLKIDSKNFRGWDKDNSGKYATPW